MTSSHDPTAASIIVLLGFATLVWYFFFASNNSNASSSSSHRQDAWSDIDIAKIAAECRESGKIWKDPSFGHDDKDNKSIGLTLELRDGERGELLNVSENSGISWQPPAKFCRTSRPVGIRGTDGVPTWLYSDQDGDTIVTAAESMNLSDAAQGSVGNCYFLSALASVVQRHPDLCDDLIDETYEEQGIYGVSFWVDGSWRMIWVDSYFPCYQPQRGSGRGGRSSNKYRLLFAGAADQKEIWPLVIEKAFAKLEGSYEAISGGHIADALKLLTGGAIHRYRPTNSNSGWEKFRNDVKQEEVLLGAGSQQLITSDAQQAAEQKKMLQGIVTGHAYTITNVYEDHNLDDDGLKLVELRNPWGRGEFKGDWGEGSKLWDRTDQGRKVKEAVGTRHKSEPGRFWMTFDDFCKCFTSVDACVIELSDEDKARRQELAEKAAQIVAKAERPNDRPASNNNNGQPEYTRESADAMMELLIAEEAREKRKKTVGARGNKRAAA